MQPNENIFYAAAARHRLINMIPFIDRCDQFIDNSYYKFVFGHRREITVLYNTPRVCCNIKIKLIDWMVSQRTNNCFE